MSVAMLWVVSPTSEVFSGVGFLESGRDGNRILDSIRCSSRCKNVIGEGSLSKGRRKRQNYSSMNADSRYACLGGSSFENGGRLSLTSSMVATPAGEIALTSEQKVYDVVLKQAALVKRRLKPDEDMDVKPDIMLPGSLGLLSEAYDRCREVCAEYAKTFYLG